MDAFDKTIIDLENNRNRLLSGEINCIPLEFERLSEYYYGLEQAEYNIWTASQKVGKTKFVDEVCMYHPFFYSLEHPEQLTVHVLYFSLEMSKEAKYRAFLCYLLYKLDKIRISPKDLKSTKRPVPIKILELIKSERYQYYIRKFKETVEFVNDIKNPTGIYKYCKNYALEHGKWHTKAGKVKNSFGEITDGQVNDYFEKNDSKAYWIIIMDNFTNLTIESNFTKAQNMEKMSKYFIELRDLYQFNCNAIQHQAQSQEGIENRKLNQLEPSSDGLGDCKVTTRDITCLWGLFNPFKYGIKQYPEGPYSYDITKLKGYVRFIKMLEGRDDVNGFNVGLFFDGANGTWFELPRYDDIQALNKLYKYVEFLENNKIVIPEEIDNNANKPSILNILKSINFKLFKN